MASKRDPKTGYTKITGKDGAVTLMSPRETKDFQASTISMFSDDPEYEAKLARPYVRERTKSYVKGK